jgi:ribosomal protein S18 acetylase RimI-like enzyme
MITNLTYRQQINPFDIDVISAILKSSGFFSAAEIDLARELAADKLAQPAESTYEFLFAQDRQVVHGYTCYGLIPATAGSYDLYWIAVDEPSRGTGLGKTLMQKTESIISSLGGKRIYVETSSRDQYRPTHGFYERCGYLREAFLKDFYAEGDSKIIYTKVIK